MAVLTRKLGKVKIKENSYGGYMYIDMEAPYDELTVIVDVEQQEQCMTEYGIEEKVRRGSLDGTLEQILTMDWQPGQPITGKIQVRESFEPPIPTNPEAFLLWKDGEVVRKDGMPVYHVEVFQRDMRKADVFLD